MPELTNIQLQFELQQSRITDNIKSYSIDSAFMAPTDGWQISYYETDLAKTRKLHLQPVRIFINGRLQMVGRVDITEVGGDGHAVTLEGRDYLSDLTECNIDPSIKLKKEMTLEQAILLACSPAGITKILGDRVKYRNIQTGINVQTKAADQGFLDQKVEEYKAEPGEGMFEFCNRILARHGATMQPTDSRDTVALVAPDYSQAPVATIIRQANNPDGAANNIISAVARRDFSSFPTHVMCNGRTSGVGQIKKATFVSSDENGERTVTEGPLATKVTQLSGVIETMAAASTPNLVIIGRLKPGESKPSKTSLYRLLYLRDEQSRNQEQLNRVMYRAAAERIKDSLQYTVTLKGHTDPATGATYAPDTVIEVQDEVCDIFERLWVEKRTFIYDDKGGPRTQLTCWHLGAFVL